MLGVLSAEGAILAALQTVGCVLLLLDRVVVPLLAFIASECDFNSCACSHSFGTSYFIYPRGGHCLPVWGGGFPLRFRKKARKKKTSRPTGNVYYSTARVGGQWFFCDLCSFFRVFHVIPSAFTENRVRSPRFFWKIHKIVTICRRCLDGSGKRAIIISN